jgi:hypothetical protein
MADAGIFDMDSLGQQHGQGHAKRFSSWILASFPAVQIALLGAMSLNRHISYNMSTGKQKQAGQKGGGKKSVGLNADGSTPVGVDMGLITTSDFVR